MLNDTSRPSWHVALAAVLKPLVAGRKIDANALARACAFLLKRWGTPSGMDPADWSDESIEEAGVATVQWLAEIQRQPCSEESPGLSLLRYILTDLHRCHRERAAYGKRRHELDDVTEPMAEAAPSDDLMAALRQALDQISGVDRELFIDAHVNGCTQRALGCRLGISHQAVHKRLCRIRQELCNRILSILAEK